ncbi:MAG: protein-L-isoaspartate O-methyltransferase family protein, partial [Rhodanobacter sp.]
MMQPYPLPPSALRGEGMTSQRARDRLAASLKEAGISDPRVIDVIRHTPRHHFIDQALHARAYENTALPIGHGQTISQPWVVARMTEAL